MSSERMFVAPYGRTLNCNRPSVTCRALGVVSLLILTACSGGGDSSASSGTSSSSSVAAPSALSITKQPQSLTIEQGQNATFSVTADGTGPLHYQWFKGATSIGTDSAILNIVGVKNADAATYSVSVSNSTGSIVSGPATLVVTKRLATISLQPTALQPGYPGMQNSQTIGVLVKDSDDQPLAGVDVSATGDASGGWVFPDHATTASNGTAILSWVPGSLGTGILTVTAHSLGVFKSATVQTQSVNPPTLPLTALNLFANNTNAATGYSIDLKPDTDPSGTYYAALVWNGGYAGLQRDGSLYHDQLQFSVWNNSTGQAAIVSLGAGVTCVPFSGEGTGEACSLNYPWTANTTYRFVMSSVAVTGGAQVSLTVTDMTSGVTTQVGTLFQPSPAALYYLNTFVEQFSRVALNCLDQPLRSYSVKRLLAKVNGSWSPLLIGSLVRQGDLSTICSNVEADIDGTWLTLKVGQRSISDPYNPQNIIVLPQ